MVREINLTWVAQLLELWFNGSMSTSPINVDKVVEALGGDVAAAQFFEITRQAIAKFRKQGRIPNARLLHLKAARPDLFEEPEQEQAAA